LWYVKQIAITIQWGSLYLPLQGSIFEDQFYAPDKDDPATPNAQVSYEILSITKGTKIMIFIQKKMVKT
jgi:hypothetical protein